MELVIDFRVQYKKFLKKNNSTGVCMGFCVTWLNDVLKNRPIRRDTRFVTKWTTGLFTSSASIAHIPVDLSAQELLFQRAKRQQEKYSKHYGHNNSCRMLGFDEFLVHYKNFREIDKESKTGDSGFIYKHRNLRNLHYADNLGFSGQLFGNIIMFHIPHLYENHAVAEISLSPQDVYFLDPNVGLYRLNSTDIDSQMTKILLSTYGEIAINDQISISPKY